MALSSASLTPVIRGTQALEGQRDGLEHLMRIVKKDKQDLEVSTPEDRRAVSRSCILATEFDRCPACQIKICCHPRKTEPGQPSLPTLIEKRFGIML